MNKIYETIKKNSLPLIERWRCQNDLLKIDKDLIESNPDIPFLHFTGSTGTNLEFLPAANNECYPPEGVKIPSLFGTTDREHILNGKQNIIHVYKYCNRGLLIQYYDGEKVKIISLATCKNILAMYTAKIKRQWLEMGRTETK